MAYREPVRGRFLCIVCFRSLSSLAGDCPECAVPRHDLGDPAVRELVRAEAERRLEKRASREVTGLVASSVVLTAPGVIFLGTAGLLFLPAVIAAGVVLLRRKSALRTYAARRRGRDTAADPAALEMDRLLEWLGARVDERTG